MKCKKNEDNKKAPGSPVIPARTLFIVMDNLLVIKSACGAAFLAAFFVGRLEFKDVFFLLVTIGRQTTATEIKASAEHRKY